MCAMTRRGLIKAGIGLACGGFFPWTAVAGPDSYYLRNRSRLLHEFAGLCLGMEQYLAAQAGPDGPQGRALDRALARAKAATDLARQTFANLLPGLPEVGGETNRNLVNVIQAGWLGAAYTGMKAQGFTARQAGRMFYDLCEADLKAKPRAELLTQGRDYFSKASRQYLEQWAEWTQLRLYPGDWVAVAVFGDGRDFVLGHDYSQCGALKYFQALNMPEIAPYFCLNDFTLSRYQDTGLARTMTLAEGHPVCDFRYKPGRPVTQGFGSETPKFPV